MCSRFLTCRGLQEWEIYNSHQLLKAKTWNSSLIPVFTVLTSNSTLTPKQIGRQLSRIPHHHPNPSHPIFPLDICHHILISLLLIRWPLQDILYTGKRLCLMYQIMPGTCRKGQFSEREVFILFVLFSCFSLEIG